MFVIGGIETVCDWCGGKLVAEKEGCSCAVAEGCFPLLVCAEVDVVGDVRADVFLGFEALGAAEGEAGFGGGVVERVAQQLGSCLLGVGSFHGGE